MQKTLKWVALATLAPAFTFADDYYWNTAAEQSAAEPLDWYDAASWKTPDDAPWTPASATVPGTEDVKYFRLGERAFFVTASQDISTPGFLPWIRYGDGNASLTFLLHPAATLYSTGLIEMRRDYAVGDQAVVNSPKTFQFLSGTLDMSNGNGGQNELRTDYYGTLRFAGANTVVKNASIGITSHDNSIVFENGVTCENVKVVFSPWGNSDNYGNSLRIEGSSTDMGDFILEGNNAFESSVAISNGVHFSSFTFARDFQNSELAFVPAGYSPTTVFSTGNVQFDIGWTQAFAPRGYHFDFGSGSQIGFNGADTKGLAHPDISVAFHGAGTVATNINLTLSATNSTLRIYDGAEVRSRNMAIGYERPNATGVVARVSGTGTLWRVEPVDSELQAVMTVGQGNGGGNWVKGAKLFVEDGATMLVSTNRNLRNGSICVRSTGIMVGKEIGDDFNEMHVTGGATVTNDLWTGIGGAFLSSGGNGGHDNLLRVDGSTYVGGAASDGIYTTTLFLGGMNGYSNRLELANGATASFGGSAMMSRSSACGGSSIAVEDSSLEVEGKIDMPGDTAAYGRSRIAIGGKRGRVSASVLTVDAGYANIDPASVGFDLELAVAEGRTAADGPMLHLTGQLGDNNKDALTAIGKENPVAALAVTLDIDHKFATSGHDNVIELVRVDTGNDATRFFENRAGLEALCNTLQSTADLKGCTLSCESDWDNRTMVLRLAAGAPKGTLILFQ